MREEQGLRVGNRERHVRAAGIRGSARCCALRFACHQQLTGTGVVCYSQGLQRPKPRPSLRSIFRSFIGLSVKIWHRNKTVCFESNPVQSSRSKSTTCLRKMRLLRFESNSTATLDGGAQKLGNGVWHASESFKTKVCSQIGRK